MKFNLKRLPIIKQVFSFAKNKGLPVWVKIITVGIFFIYLAMPFDFITDFAGMLGIGYLDDFIVAGILFGGVPKLWKQYGKYFTR